MQCKDNRKTGSLNQAPQKVKIRYKLLFDKPDPANSQKSFRQYQQCFRRDIQDRPNYQPCKKQPA